MSLFSRKVREIDSFKGYRLTLISVILDAFIKNW